MLNHSCNEVILQKFFEVLQCSLAIVEHYSALHYTAKNNVHILMFAVTTSACHMGWQLYLGYLYLADTCYHDPHAG